jgi:hypothetical protein
LKLETSATVKYKTHPVFFATYPHDDTLSGGPNVALDQLCCCSCYLGGGTGSLGHGRFLFLKSLSVEHVPD